MAVKVRDGFGDFETHDEGVGFKTDEYSNNLEVIDATGHLIAAYAKDHWVSAVIE